MKKFSLMLGALLMAGALVAAPASAGDSLFYYGHGGLNEGHAQWGAIIAGEGGSLDFNNAATLPSLAGYTLVAISTPGWQDPGAFFSVAEKDALNAFLADGAHKVVLIGEWDGFYGAGQAVLIDLVNSIGGGTGIAFIPGAYDCGCFSYNCDGALGASPLVTGLTHVCRACTAIWNPGSGGSVAFTVESPANPWVVDNGTNIPCIVCIGDSNTLSDSCGHLTDADTAEFARRLYTITCAGEPVPTESTTWGQLKGLYR
jgi:hypothetical protein